MSDFKSRLIEEKQELQTKVSKLGDFLNGVKPTTLSEANLILLGQQYEAMTHYLNILKIRLEFLG